MRAAATTTYALAVDGMIYPWSPETGEQFTLVSAFAAALGTGNAKVMRLTSGGGWVVVVDRAGTTHDAEHVTSGHRFRRRRWRGDVIWGRFGWNRRRWMELAQELLAPVGPLARR
jgi:hypothetical protein